MGDDQEFGAVGDDLGLVACLCLGAVSVTPWKASPGRQHPAS